MSDYKAYWPSEVNEIVMTKVFDFTLKTDTSPFNSDFGRPVREVE